MNVEESSRAEEAALNDEKDSLLKTIKGIVEYVLGLKSCLFHETLP